MFKFMNKRANGVLLHITSLPSEYGVGDLGPAAYEFADFLFRSGQSYWQVLPLNPPAIEIPHSPYNCISAFAGNWVLISPQLLKEDGLLTAKELADKPCFPDKRVDFHSVIPYKRKLLNKAYRRFKSRPIEQDYERFCRENSFWLEDFALFSALRRHFGSVLWYDWSAQFRDSSKAAEQSLVSRLSDDINREKFLQYEFFRQWYSLKRYCNERGVKIIGDIAIYVSCDSADVWSKPRFFKLTKSRKPQVVSGVPPDYFNKAGQLWGNPVYDWPALKKADYSWWFERIGHNLKLFDVVRLDHFRGFVAYWEVQAGHKTAAKGRWIRAPKDDFFARLFKKFPDSAIIVEDLGHITPAVRAFVDKSGFAGMRIVLYGFDTDKKRNVHYPGTHIKNCVAYSGTHDNNTIQGWYESTSEDQKARLFECIGPKVPTGQLHWKLINVTMKSAANLTIIAMQDILGLGAKARMNLPGSFSESNWVWKLRKEQVTKAIAGKLNKTTKANARARL